MRLSVPVSAFLHLLVFLWFAYGLNLSRQQEDLRLPDIIPVDVVEISNITRAPAKEERPEPQPEPVQEPEPEPAKPEPQAQTEPEPETAKPEPEPEAAAPDEQALPPPEPEAKPEPKPEPPKPEPQPEPEKKPEPKPEPKAAPVAQPKVKPKPPSRFDPSKIAALIDKKAKEAPPPAKVDNTDKLAEAVKRSQQSSLDSQRATASLVAVIRAQVERCWNPPLGAKNVQNMRVELTIRLNQDGSLQGMPQFDADARARMRRSGEEFYRTFAESAQRAIQRCAPFELPRESYEEWRDARLVFDPREMIN